MTASPEPTATATATPSATPTPTPTPDLDITSAFTDLITALANNPLFTAAGIEIDPYSSDSWIPSSDGLKTWGDNQNIRLVLTKDSDATTITFTATLKKFDGTEWVNIVESVTGTGATVDAAAEDLMDGFVTDAVSAFQANYNSSAGNGGSAIGEN